MTTKTRTLSEYTDGRWSLDTDCVYDNGQGILPYPMKSHTDYQGNTGTYLVLSETLSGSGGRGNNAVEHNRRDFVYLKGGIAAMYRWTYRVNPWYKVYVRISNVCNAENMVTWGGVAGAGLTPPAFAVAWPANWEVLYSSQALQAMWPGVNSTTSIPNFIYELRDLRTLQRSCLSILRLVNPGNSRTLGDYINKLSRGWAEFHLSKEFGVKPFVKDLHAIGGSLAVARKEAKRLYSQQNRPLRSHYAKELAVPSPATGYYNWTLAGYPCKRKLTSVYSPSFYHATLDYHYGLEGKTLNQLEKLALLDVLGFNWNPRIIWDMLPWSFVVDWLVGVGNFLDGYKIPNVQPVVVVDGFCHSVKTERVLERSNQLLYDLEYLEPHNAMVPIYRERQKSYIRRPYLPNFHSALQLSGLSTREITLASALTRTRVRV